MRFKTTKKAIIKNYSKIVKIGYRRLGRLLAYHAPIAYTAGVYGWSADVYDIDGVAIATGYRPFGNICPDCQIVEEYEALVREIPYSSKHRDELDFLICQFIAEVVNNG